MFPVDGQAKLSTELSKAEVVDFINYFQRLHKWVLLACWRWLQTDLKMG